MSTVHLPSFITTHPGEIVSGQHMRFFNILHMARLKIRYGDAVGTDQFIVYNQSKYCAPRATVAILRDTFPAPKRRDLFHAASHAALLRGVYHWEFEQAFSSERAFAHSGGAAKWRSPRGYSAYNVRPGVPRARWGTSR